MNSDTVLEQAAKSWQEKTPLIPPSELETTLLEKEKITKKQKISYSFEQLVGTWQLFYLIGTKRKKLGISLGKGRYLPRLINISLSYSTGEELSHNQGTIKNYVNLGILQFSLTGPVKFLPPRNMLVFDFTRLNVKFLGANVYNGYIRSGKAREESFYTDKVSQQAFFSYFYISKLAIAARGRGGGIALWSRLKE